MILVGPSHLIASNMQHGGMKNSCQANTRKPSLTSLTDPFCYTVPITSSISHTDFILEVIDAVDLKGSGLCDLFYRFSLCE